MEEQKIPKAPEIIADLKALGKQGNSNHMDIQTLRKAVLMYKDKSQKRPPPSILGKRVYFAC